MPANTLQQHTWAHCVLRSVRHDLDTRTLVLNVHLPALSIGECRRIVITNCDCEYSGQLGGTDVASRRLIAEPSTPASLCIVRDSGVESVANSGSVTFATATGSITVTGGTASVDEYQLSAADIPLDLTRAEIAEYINRAA